MKGDTRASIILPLAVAAMAGSTLAQTAREVPIGEDLARERRIGRGLEERPDRPFNPNASPDNPVSFGGTRTMG